MMQDVMSYIYILYTKYKCEITDLNKLPECVAGQKEKFLLPA